MNGMPVTLRTRNAAERARQIPPAAYGRVRARGEGLLLERAVNSLVVSALLCQVKGHSSSQPSLGVENADLSQAKQVTPNLMSMLAARGTRRLPLVRHCNMLQYATYPSAMRCAKRGKKNSVDPKRAS